MTAKYYVVGILLTAAALAATIMAYPQLPANVATHWDIHGQPNGYSPKWAMFLLGPGIMAMTLFLTWLMPWLSPKQFGVEGFRSTYLQIMLIVVVLWAYLDGVLLWAGTGHSANASRAMLGGVCVLFALLGNLMGKVRRNFFIGIRTPWALASDHVWNATHRLAAKTLVLSGLAGLALTALGQEAWPPLTLLMIGALIPAAYSLIFSKQLERRGEL